MSEPFPLVMDDGRIDPRRLARSLAFAYIGMPTAAAIMKPSTELGAAMADGLMARAVRQTWFKRKRRSKTMQRNQP